jgi:hypothetical protein
MDSSDSYKGTKYSQPSKKTHVNELSIKEHNVEPQELPEEFFEEHQIQAYEKLIEYNIRNMRACDTTIIIGKETFKCHSIVLKVQTEYFVKLEASGFSLEVIELPTDQVSINAFREIYNWMLNDDYKIPRTKFADIFKTAIFLKVKDLVKECMAIIDDKSIIGEREAISIFLEAKQINCKLLQSHMVKKISKIFLTFVASLDFLELNFEEVHEFFKSNCIAVNSEIDMLFVALRWIEFEWPKRKNCVKKLFKLIKFEVLPSWMVVEIRSYPEKYAHIFDLVVDILNDAQHYHSQRHAAEEGFEGFKSEFHMAIPRKRIDDPKWKALNIQDNPHVFDAYDQFKIYLKKLDGTHWKKVKFVENQVTEIIQ